MPNMSKANRKCCLMGPSLYKLEIAGLLSIYDNSRIISGLGSNPINIRIKYTKHWNLEIKHSFWSNSAKQAVPVEGMDLQRFSLGTFLRLVELNLEDDFSLLIGEK